MRCPKGDAMIRLEAAKKGRTPPAPNPTCPLAPSPPHFPLRGVEAWRLCFPRLSAKGTPEQKPPSLEAAKEAGSAARIEKERRKNPAPTLLLGCASAHVHLLPDNVSREAAKAAKKGRTPPAPNPTFLRALSPPPRRRELPKEAEEKPNAHSSSRLRAFA